MREAESAFKREVEEMKTAKADPFTRRQCRPTLVTKVTPQIVSVTMETVFVLDNSALYIGSVCLSGINEITPYFILSSWPYLL